MYWPQKYLTGRPTRKIRKYLLYNLHLKAKYGIKSENRLTCYFHYYVTRFPLKTAIVTMPVGKGRWQCRAFKSGKKNSNTIKHIYN